MGTIQADLNELKNLEQKTKNAKAKIDAIPGQLSFSLSGALSELSGVWNGELEGLQQELEKSIRDYSEELGKAGQVVSKTYQELKAADEALLQALGLDSEIAPQKTSKGKAEGSSKKKKEKEEGNAFTQSLKGIGDGAGDALSDTWDGIVSFAKHPVDSTVDTAKGVYEAGKHPIRTYNTVKDGVVTAVDEKLIHGDAYSRSHFFSYAGTEIGLAAIGDKGAGLAVKGASGSKKLLKEAGKNVKEAHKATVKQKAPALQPAVAGVRNTPPRNVINMNYVNNLLQNLKGMNWSFAKKLGENRYTLKTMKHIYHGEVKWNRREKKNKVVGYHHESMMGGAKLVPGTETKPDKNGIYKAKVEINGEIKLAKSSFFPKDWNRVQVLEAINEAYDNKTQIDENKFSGKTSSGIWIDMYLNKDGSIATAYPIYKRR
ncbi:EndoU domain-containing protein [Priestia endophytica]|uniref:EndoU domain-containing protein n=1 Tax=Priestia endophytica TaxID=135735 RepID=UPI00227F7036|nr:EndoU domain-containing protein [Priestia endophytica]MCY8232349.1 EndoU domain-containing protein [Priestia endophytica]